MPYGNLRKQVVQRFADVDDLREQKCTIEEMEEYEPHIREGFVVFAGADYEKVIAAAESESDVLVWDGGNNDTPFVRPQLLITLIDPLRAGDEVNYFPGLWNFEHADVLVHRQDRRSQFGSVGAHPKQHSKAQRWGDCH